MVIAPFSLHELSQSRYLTFEIFEVEVLLFQRDCYKESDAACHGGAGKAMRTPRALNATDH